MEDALNFHNSFNINVLLTTKQGSKSQSPLNDVFSILYSKESFEYSYFEDPLYIEKFSLNTKNMQKKNDSNNNGAGMMGNMKKFFKSFFNQKDQKEGKQSKPNIIKYEEQQEQQTIRPNCCKREQYISDIIINCYQVDEKQALKDAPRNNEGYLDGLKCIGCMEELGDIEIKLIHEYYKLPKSDGIQRIKRVL